MAYTVRERILRQWKANLVALRNQADTADLFDTVERTPLDRSDFSGNYACSLMDEGEEAAVYEVGYLEINMIVTVEFWVRIMEGIDASEELNEIAGLITKEFLSNINTDEDVTSDQLSLNIQQGQLDFDIDGPTDRYVAGARTFVITYRHGKQDPYVLA